MRKIIFLSCLTLSLVAKKHDLYTGVQTAHVKLKQTNLGPHHSGYLTGPLVGYTFRDIFYANVSMSKAWGTLHPAYRTQDVLIDGSLGWTFNFLPRRVFLTPKLGMGYEFTKEFRKNDSKLVVTFRKPYFSVGGLFEAQITDYLRFGLDAKGMFDLDTTLEVGGFPGSRWMLTKRNDFMLQVPWTYERHDRYNWEIALAPYYRLLRHGKSFAVSSTGIPLNQKPDSFTYIGIIGTIHAKF